MGLYKCKTTAEERQINAPNPKEAADIFMKELTQGMYKFKLKKVLIFSVKKDPDTSVVVTDLSTNKISYFQFTTFINS